MTEDQTGNLVYAVLGLMLVASSLFARRLPLGQTLRMALSWVAIFGVMFVLFTFRAEFKQVWQRVKSEFVGGGSAMADGTLRVPQGEDGHFHVDASINGHTVRLLVDSGATTTSLSVATAKAAGLDVDTDGFPVIVETANGMAEARRARAAQFDVGPIKRSDFPVLVAEGLGDGNLIGMNFLSTLKGWRVEGDVLVLNP
jgi:aspartyl protease family protein